MQKIKTEYKEAFGNILVLTIKGQGFSFDGSADIEVDGEIYSGYSELISQSYNAKKNLTTVQLQKPEVKEVDMSVVDTIEKILKGEIE